MDTRTGFRTRAVLCVPVRDSTGRVIAVLQAINRQEPALDTHMGGMSAMGALDEAAALSSQVRSNVPLSPRSAELAAENTFSFTAGDMSVLEAMGNTAGVVLRKAQIMEDLVCADLTCAL